MDSSLIRFHYLSLNPHTFPLPNVISNHNHRANHCYNNDIEMIALHSISSYTSLKDLMPASPPLTASPTGIPIKDPLLQHAAWAYLQPMAAAERGGGERWWWRRLVDKCCGMIGCFNGVVLMVFEGFFSGKGSEPLMIRVD